MKWTEILWREKIKSGGETVFDQTALQPKRDEENKLDV